ncbi:cysteine--tRNA ligase [Microbispora triticiradicis]|uniref:Cysteine--tRNA ligase n=2 Tax=Microbispora TaxID=2005 RepID=A0ABY3M054_9ACTN|nr:MULTISPECIES: cysteine--tRNA ligase [Microbispora]TLP53594.1 cysteine--tRNA ligase [Microbispora fusca]TYB61245.1 cysteine--tRNA ligase [Microbispora tritici]
MLRLHDTLTRQIVPLVPAGSRILRMHTCAAHGPAGLGDPRPHLLADLIRRLSERAGLRVLACRNVYDLGHGSDDGASLEAESLALNLRVPEHSPRTSETMGLIIELIGRLIERGHAYATPEGAVMFDAASFPAYGEIRGEAASGDWTLWEPGDEDGAGAGWDAPWGRGLPSRDIECTATPLRFLGPRFDLYVGGDDLRSPHHERVRAQSNAATGEEAAAHWAHAGRLLFEGRPVGSNGGSSGESEGDSPGGSPDGSPDGSPGGSSGGSSGGADTGAVTPSRVAAAGLDPLAVRLALLRHPYRQQVDLTWDTLKTADAELRRLRRSVAEWAESPSRPIDAAHAERVQSALDNDLDTPEALRLLGDLETDESVAPGAKFETFLHFDHVLALDLPAEIGRI